MWKFNTSISIVKKVPKRRKFPSIENRVKLWHRVNRVIATDPLPDWSLCFARHNCMYMYELAITHSRTGCSLILQSPSHAQEYILVNLEAMPPLHVCPYSLHFHAQVTLLFLSPLYSSALLLHFFHLYHCHDSVPLLHCRPFQASRMLQLCHQPIGNGAQ